MRELVGKMNVARRSLRLLLAVVVLTAGCGFTVSAPAAAWVAIGTSGQTGPHKVFDSLSLAGVICENDLTSKPGFVVIEARDALLGPASGYAAQTVGVQYQLYQELPGGALDLIDRSPLERQSVEASRWAGFGPYTFGARALGPRYVVVVEMIWYDTAGVPSGRVRARMSNYEIRTHHPGNVEGEVRTEPFCRSPLAPAVHLGASQGTVQSSIGYSLHYYPSESAVSVLWDGKAIGTVMTTANGSVAGSLQVPAAPMGRHQIQWIAGNWRSSATFTIVPRIKLIPSTVSRGQTVNVSLRGYAAREVVRIRWKKGSSWVELARVTTSSTGSANVNIKVPSWAPNGSASVRGDGTYGRAQTNAVTVSGGPLSGSVVRTPTPTMTPSPTATLVPTQTPTIEATATMAPTETPTPAAPINASPMSDAP